MHSAAIQTLDSGSHKDTLTSNQQSANSFWRGAAYKKSKIKNLKEIFFFSPTQALERAVELTHGLWPKF